MYLREIKLWNFRKFGSENSVFQEIEDDKIALRIPDLVVPFTKGLNVLIGENDSGKTAIVDAVKLVLKTHSYEWIRLKEEDFFKNAEELRIECVFKDLSVSEGKNFTEWLSWEGEGENAEPFLKVIFYAQKKDGKILPFDIKAGGDDFGYQLNGEAKEYLQTTYLRPLRDAESEFTPRKNSRLSQILAGHEAFKRKNKDHYLVNLFEEFNRDLQLYFEGKKYNKVTDNEEAFDPESEKEQLKGKDIQEVINKHLKKISDFDSSFNPIEPEVKKILESLTLGIINQPNSGLGTYNKLYIAAELLHLEKKDWDGIRLGLIEEIEAHLHPQAQLRVIEHLQNQENEGVQLILTTHSPNLASKVKLKNLIICSENADENPSIFPMGYKNPEEVDEKQLQPLTDLTRTDYMFLERFLDTTKANLFFAKGVILVEGWSEEFLIPAIAEKMGINLTDYGVSVVNVGSTAFLRYAHIFQRKIEGDAIEPEQKKFQMKMPVSVITDLDIKPEKEDGNLEKNREAKAKKFTEQNVRGFVSPKWTLEYCLGLSPTLAPLLFEATKSALVEMRNDGSSTSAEITESYSDISSGATQETVASKIYKDFILGKRISKAIIAQKLTTLIQQNAEITKEVLEAPTEKFIDYLIDAIKYATRN